MSEPDITHPGLELGFSIQSGPDGPFVGIHWGFPMSNTAFAIPIEWAEELVVSFPHELAKIIEQAKQQRSGLVVAPASAITTLKGTQS